MTYRIVKIAITALFTVLFASISISAQNYSGLIVDVKIYFRYDKAHIDSTYMDNQQHLHLVDSLLNDSLYISTLRRIEVSAQSSPEGATSYNERLAERRRLSLKEYFTTNYPQIDSTLWSFNTVAENWDLFHQHLQEDPNLPNRDQILSISASDRDTDDKERMLKRMNNGKPWLYISENILPLQRFGASVLFIPLSPPITAIPTAIAPYQTIEPLELPQCPPIAPQETKLRFALKTNLVLDVVSVVNLAVEIPIKDRWSVVGEMTYPWWRSWPANFTMQIESYHAEVKYWLGDRSKKEQLQGWSVGLYGGFGLYDIQLFSEEGVSGDFFDAGAQISYSHPITKSKRLYLEYALGLGYLSTDYNDYYMVYDTEEFGDIKVIPYPWMNTKLQCVIPSRLGVSLVWHIGKKTKGGTQ